MGESPSPGLEVLNESGCGARVEFHWKGDRFFHTLMGIRRNKVHPLLESLEGDAHDQFPPSPCLSQVHQQDQTLFFTGATSECHWSASVQPSKLNLVGESPEPFDVLSFEFACRLKKQSHQMCGAYRILGAAKMHIPISGHFAFVMLSDYKEPVAIMIDSENLLFTDENSILRLSTDSQSPNSFPCTIQWKFRIGWAGNS